MGTNDEGILQANDRLRSLAEANAALTATLQLQPLLDTIGRALLRLGKAESLWLLTVDHKLRQASGHALYSRSKTDAHLLLEALGAANERHTFSLDGATNPISSCIQDKAPAYSTLRGPENDQMAAIFGYGPGGRAGAGELSVIPLVAGDQVLAVAALLGRGAPGFPQEEQETVEAFASTAALALRNALLFGEVEKSGTIDALTQVNGHRTICGILSEETARATRYDRPLSVMMIDIDDFKFINHILGHLAGDRVLRRVARLLRKVCRSTDRLGRYGGDEFLLVLPETDAENAEVVSQRVLSALQNEKIVIGDGHSAAVTCSIGLASYPPAAADEHEILEEACFAMYRAKEAGGNRAVAGRGHAAEQSSGGTEWPDFDGTKWTELNGPSQLPDAKERLSR